MSRFVQYLKDTRGELKHVSWPTRKQAIINAALVVGVSILVALFLGFFDFIFSGLLDRFIIR
jgi:preprotein translocase subunit SecE